VNQMTLFPVYDLTLFKSYYEKGFLNFGVDVDRFIRTESGSITIYLGNSKKEMKGRVDRGLAKKTKQVRAKAKVLITMTKFPKLFHQNNPSRIIPIGRTCYPWSRSSS